MAAGPRVCGVTRRCARRAWRVLALAAVTFLGTVSTAAAQQSLTDVLSFLLTNRSIPTGDFEGDAEAAAATRDTIANFLLTEIGTLPVSSSATGFIYRMDPDLGGVPTRASESFGPFHTERALTIGPRRLSLGMAFQRVAFDRIDGRSLRNGTLIATASRLVSEPQPFDVETLTLRLRMTTATVSINAGITDRLEVGAALPVVSLNLAGERVDTYRGNSVLQATATASGSGMGDVIWRAKYNFLQREASGLSVVVDGRLPTGRTEDLFGSGRRTFRPRLIASLEGDRVTVNGDAGYVFGSFSDEFNYAVGATASASARLTFIGELVGRRLSSAGQLTEVAAPHPVLVGVETIRLTATEKATQRVVALGGVKWNAATAWLITTHVSRFLTDAGLTARWVPTVSLEYSFGG